MAAVEPKSRKRGAFRAPLTGVAGAASPNASPAANPAARRRSGEALTPNVGRVSSPPHLGQPPHTQPSHQATPSPNAKLRARSPHRVGMSSTYATPVPTLSTMRSTGPRYTTKAADPPILSYIKPTGAAAAPRAATAGKSLRSTSLDRVQKRSTSKDRARPVQTHPLRTAGGVRSSSADRARTRESVTPSQGVAATNGHARMERMMTAPHPTPKPRTKSAAFSTPTPKTPPVNARKSNMLVNSKTTRTSARSPGAQLRRMSPSGNGTHGSPSPMPEAAKRYPSTGTSTPTLNAKQHGHAATATHPAPKSLFNERGRADTKMTQTPTRATRTSSTASRTALFVRASSSGAGRAKALTRSNTHSHQTPSQAKRTGAHRTHSLPGKTGSPKSASPRPNGNVAKGAPLMEVEDMTGTEPRDLNYGEGGYGLVYSGDILDDRYELVQQIGRGQSSTVWLARDQHAAQHAAHAASASHPEYVAIKLTRCSKNVRCSSSHEVALLYYISRNTIGHDGVARLLDHFQHKGKYGIHVCMVFELLGRPLDALMASTGFRGLKDMLLVKNITLSILQTLKQLKHINVVHTDLKPENLMFVRVNELEDASLKDGTVKISDFGLSFLLKAKDGLKPNGEPYSDADLRVIRASNYVKGALIQTREYRAPEIILGNDFSCETDIWSLACIVFEMVTGRFLFDPKSKPGVTDELSNDFEHLSEITQLIGRPTIGSGVLKGGVFIRNFYDKDGRFKGSYNNRMTDTFSLVLASCQERSEASLIFDFIMSCLTWSPDTRPTAEDCLKHPWLSGYDTESSASNAST